MYVCTHILYMYVHTKVWPVLQLIRYCTWGLGVRLAFIFTSRKPLFACSICTRAHSIHIVYGMPQLVSYTKEYSLLSLTSVYFIHSRSDSTVDLPVLQARGYAAVPLHLTGWGIRVRPHGWGTQYCTKNLVWRQASGRSPTSHVRTCERIGEGEAPFRSVVATGDKQTNKQTNFICTYINCQGMISIEMYMYICTIF